MKKYLLFLLVTLLSSTAYADIIDDVAAAFKSGDVKELSKYFASTIELNAEGQEGVYSNVQAEQILKDFFQKNTPGSVKVVHRVVSNANYKFGVIQLNTNKGTYRISYELKSMSGNFLVTQVRIEENKG
ncbi:DUF4783 domain-containing protein [Pseudoxanthomonas sp. SGD-10]|nr:DUF4783 domain-containing protein [Pseudoxanthomonas sp. SGD-10]